MSDTEKRPYVQVKKVADSLVEALSPACHRIEIAGSLRRKREMVGDIELVAIPKRLTNLIGEPMETTEVDNLLARWPVDLHKNGQKYKAFSLEWRPGWTFKVDLFLQPDPATWGYNFMVRTGSAEFSKAMVTPQPYGYKPQGFEIDGARVWHNGVLLDTHEEADVFKLWGMAFVPPEER